MTTRAIGQQESTGRLVAHRVAAAGSVATGVTLAATSANAAAASNAAFSLDAPRAMACQNRTRSSRRAVEGTPRRPHLPAHRPYLLLTLAGTHRKHLLHRCCDDHLNPPCRTGVRFHLPSTRELSPSFSPISVCRSSCARQEPRPRPERTATGTAPGAGTKPRVSNKTWGKNCPKGGTIVKEERNMWVAFSKRDTRDCTASSFF